MTYPYLFEKAQPLSQALTLEMRDSDMRCLASMALIIQRHVVRSHGLSQSPLTAEVYASDEVQQIGFEETFVMLSIDRGRLRSPIGW